MKTGCGTEMKDQTITVKHSLRMLVPRMPNFIRVQGSEHTIPVSDLSDESVEEIIEAWGVAFREHCGKRRSNT